MASEFEHISPSSQIRKRLLKHKPAMFGLFVILFAVFVAIAGHTIMPDKTPNANDGAVQISKELPVFETTLLKMSGDASGEQIIIKSMENLMETINSMLDMPVLVTSRPTMQPK